MVGRNTVGRDTDHITRPRSAASVNSETLIKPTREQLTYGDYLKVHELLNLQIPQSDPEAHDELLFIVIHQAYELWFKQMLHEFAKACSDLRQDRLQSMLQRFNRIQTIQKLLIQQVDILETMTTVDFNAFRTQLNPASGFQSYQFRLIEFTLGYRDEKYLAFYKHDPKARAALESALQEPSLYDHFLAYLDRRGVDLPKELLQRNVSEPWSSHPKLRDTFLKIYRTADQNFELYSALEALLNLDENLLLWRYRHVVMVERMIGRHYGTGGSTGVDYLTATLEKRCFPEIWEVRNFIGTATKVRAKACETHTATVKSHQT